MKTTVEIKLNEQYKRPPTFQLKNGHYKMNYNTETKKEFIQVIIIKSFINGIVYNA